MSNHSSYRCAISKMSLIVGAKEIIIPTINIKSIIIDTNYEERIMPIIYASLNITLELYNTLVSNLDNGKIYLNIKKYDVNISAPVREDKIKNQFIYFMPTNSTYVKDLNPEDNTDSSYISVTLGLMDMKLLEYKKKNFNTVYRNIDTKNLINIITSGRELILDPIEKNVQYEEFLMPPLTSRSDALQYLFSTNTFYNTMYTYFTDFDKNYLINRNGKTSSPSTMNTIFIDIKKIDSRSSYYDGMTIDTSKKCYIIFLNPDDKSISPNKATEKVVNQIIGVEGEEITKLDLNINNSKHSSTTKPMFIRGHSGDIIVAKSQIESTAVILNFGKADIDGDIFTPDKCYTVSNYEEDMEYNGRYILIYKKEIIGKTDTDYNTKTIVGLRYVGEN